MRKITLFILAATYSLAAFGQQSEGIVTYQQKVNLHKKIEDEAMKAYVPEFQTAYQELLFSATESVYRGAGEKEAKTATDESNWTDDQGGNVQIRIDRPKNVTYFNFAEKKRVESKDFLGRTFLIEAEMKAIPWKITGEVKKLNDRQCNRAVFEDTENERTIVAWFAPGIPSQAGPGIYGQLPGLVMEVDINDGEIVTVATDIAFKKIAEGVIVPPVKGKKVSDAEYQQIVDEKMKEMGMEGGGKGGIKIKIKND